MTDDVDAFKRAPDSFRILDVADHQLGFRVHEDGTALAGTVSNNREIVENTNVVTGRQKLVCDMRSDESGTSGDQCGLFH
jgi:hypothetical protein